MNSKPSITQAFRVVLLICPLLALPRVSSVNAQANRTPADTSLFATVVQSLASRVDSIPVAQDRVLRVNPRPLRSDPKLTWVREEDLATVGGEIIEKRAATLRRLGVEQFSEFPEVPCSDTRGGLPSWNVPSTSQKRGPVAVCANVALPRAGGAHYPAEQIDERREGIERGHQTTRVVLRNSSMLRVYDIVAVPAPGGSGWQIVEWRQLFSLQS